MTRDEADIVRRKLATIQRDVIALESLRGMSLEEYTADFMRRKAVERLLQEAIEAAVDCGAHLLARAGSPAPVDMFSTFRALADLGVLDTSLATALAPAAGLRNRLVHEYDDIDDAKVFAAIPLAIDRLTRFIAAVSGYVGREER